MIFVQNISHKFKNWAMKCNSAKINTSTHFIVHAIARHLKTLGTLKIGGGVVVFLKEIDVFYLCDEHINIMRVT